VCAISSLSACLDDDVKPGPSKEKSKLSVAEVYFQASQRRIGMLYHENSLLAAQCSFLTAVYLMFTLQPLAAWKSFVQASSQCLAWMKSQGRMMKADSSNTDSSLEQDRSRCRDNLMNREHHIEESLYWSCLKSEM
jgi:hypothetical protein